MMRSASRRPSQIRSTPTSRRDSLSERRLQPQVFVRLVGVWHEQGLPVFLPPELTDQLLHLFRDDEISERFGAVSVHHVELVGVDQHYRVDIQEVRIILDDADGLNVLFREKAGRLVAENV